MADLNGVREFSRGILDKIYDVLFPQDCIYCEGERRTGGVFLCNLCRKDVALISRPYCNRCGRPLDTSYEFSHEAFECAPCRKDASYFDQARSLGIYEAALKQLIHHFKYNKQPAVMREIAPLLQAYFREPNEFHGEFWVVTVPLHVRKLRNRGFDQSYLIAREIAEIINMPLRADILARVKETEPQASKHKNDRLKNVRDAFIVNRPEEVRGRDLLLVDDVFTTGATLNEAARVLKKAKAGRVLAFTVARA